MPASGNSVASETTMALPVAVARCSWKRVDRRDQVFAVGGGQLRHAGAAGEGDDADLHVARQLLQEGLGRLLRGHQPVGLDVGRAHAARHVHRQDDGLLVRGQHHHRHRPRGGDQHRDQREQEQEGRDVAAHASGRRPSPRARSTGWHSAAPASSCAAAARRTAAPAAAPPPAARGIEARGSSCCHRLGLVPSAGAHAALAHVGEAHDRLHQVVVGREFERVDADLGQRLAQRRLRARRRCGRSACESRRRACRPRAARRSRRRAAAPGPGRAVSSSSGSNRRTATTSWRCTSCASARSQPGSLRKSDTTNTVERRGISTAADLSRSRQPGHALLLGLRPSGARGAPSRAAGAARGGGRCAAGSPPRRRCRRPARRPGCRAA